MGWGSDIAGGVISAGGSILSTGMNNSSAKHFAENAAQIRVKDLRAAGLNPVLAASKGGLGAAQAPQLSKPDFTPISNLYQAHSARMQAENAQKGTDSTVLLQKVQSAKMLMDMEVAKSQKHLIDEQALTQNAVRANYASSTNLNSAHAVRSNYQAVQDKVISDYLKTPIGQESARVSFDNKSGGRVGAVNAASSYADRLINGGSSHSAKGISEVMNKRITIPNVKYSTDVSPYK
jgi:hypothetical protein